MTIMIAALALALYASAGPQEGQPAAQDTSRGEILNRFVQQRQEADSSDGFAPVLPTSSTLQALSTLDSTTARSYLLALRSQYDYKVEGFRHRARVFRWQFHSSIVIFIVVVFLVLVGLYFSWLQFKRDLAVSGSTPAETQLDVSAKGIRVQSSVLGVIILVISLLFFYLYLVYVYPIQEIL